MKFSVSKLHELDDKSSLLTTFTLFVLLSDASRTVFFIIEL